MRADADDALTLRHDLADLGLDGGDDARGVGAEFGVGEVVLGRGELAARLVDAGERGRGSDWRCSRVCGVKAAPPRSCW